MRTYEPARRATGGIGGKLVLQVAKELVPMDTKTDNDSEMSVPILNLKILNSYSKQDAEKFERPREGKRSRVSETANQNHSGNQSNLNLASSSGPAETPSVNGNASPNEEVAKLKKENETLLGLLYAKNDEIQTLTKMLRENTAEWTAEEERLKKENLEAKRLLRENRILVNGITNSIDKIKADCIKVATNTQDYI